MKQERALALKIINASAKAFGIKPKEMYAKSRIQQVVDAKSCAAYLIQKILNQRLCILHRITGLDYTMLRLGNLRMLECMSLNDNVSRQLVEKMKSIEDLVLKKRKPTQLKAEDLNQLAGCNIAGRIKVAQSLIDDKEYQRAHEELDDLLKFVNTPQHHTAKVVIEIKNGTGKVVEQPDYIYVEFK